MLRLGVLAAAASVVVVVVVVVARRRKAPRLRLALWHDGASDVAALATLLDGVALVEVDATREAPERLRSPGGQTPRKDPRTRVGAETASSRDRAR